MLLLETVSLSAKHNTDNLDYPAISSTTTVIPNDSVRQLHAR